MKDGEWMTSPDAIAFDDEGRLVNGQHRLKAVVRSGEVLEDVLVAWNLGPEARKICDVGAKRRASDMLHIEGFKKPQELAATIKLVILWLDGRLEDCNQYENVENHHIVRVAETCTPRIYDSLRQVDEHKQFLVGRMPRSLAGTPCKSVALLRCMRRRPRVPRGTSVRVRRSDSLLLRRQPPHGLFLLLSILLQNRRVKRTR